MGVLCMARDLKLDFGIELSIDKGIPLGSGLGGSAASAVAAVVAANALLPEPLGKLELLKFAMKGEAVASGCGARRQHRPVAVRRPGADGRHRQSQRQADPGAVHRALRAGASAHDAVDARGAADPQPLHRSVGRDLAICEPRRIPHRMLHRRLAADTGVARRRDHRAAAPGADSGLQSSQGGRHGATARSGARFRAPGRPCSPGASNSMPSAFAMRWSPAFAAHGLASDAWISTLDPAGARIID